MMDLRIFTQKTGKISLKNQNIGKLYHIASICQEKIVQIRLIFYGMGYENSQKKQLLSRRPP
jgi:hypothetical protein